ncbi:hypothetical protein D1814_06810 [Alteromonas sp. BL110]|uniref:hypothetical protein n=1 Tax=Alteromonas sp. BL110 TaxID=1714845 RepID=UPI000E53D96A|nr:hypothetical protein [Alteromonas sp. BL110]AXT38404.1 hypothetical protein D1814_06810 [Alteromonas sp. BL110]RKM83852.1 hypothetical protein D7031_02120 [Alteromonas sp. BL110]
MYELTETNLSNVTGGNADRETNQLMASMFAGAVSGGNGFVMAGAAYLMGLTYDFSPSGNTGPSGPASNHLTTAQFRSMHRGE